ncbi:hypothetical protein KZZ52_03530 [Dactylosporangium sp. AC04546]|uniref:hypothetical protein n=1 Tax=Dactylosporangium sp. AC04546 TaxID=2862460 RepID=UPI001EDDFA9C|nr:hypothetical protein [Dactylosporangium sp. AC04546]WVK84510.1 hypothetical protein KZZ52_03530 [Dactylosporangium sp. AC04546]
MKRRWIIAGTAAWALVIGGLAYFSYRYDSPTARDQTTIAEALPTLDTALGSVYAGLDPASSVAVLSGYNRTDQSCRVTSAREGTRFERVLMVYVRSGDEGPTLDRIKAALPASYKASVSHSVTTHTLSADAGNFVLLRGGMVAAGQLRFTADTGCRVQDAPVEEATPHSQNANRAPVQAVLDTLAKPASEWRTHRLTCPSGGTLWTVEAKVATPDDTKARATVPESAVIQNSEKLFAYRAGEAGVTLRKDAETLIITSTAGC